MGAYPLMSELRYTVVVALSRNCMTRAEVETPHPTILFLLCCCCPPSHPPAHPAAAAAAAAVAGSRPALGLAVVVDAASSLCAKSCSVGIHDWHDNDMTVEAAHELTTNE